MDGDRTYKTASKLFRLTWFLCDMAGPAKRGCDPLIGGGRDGSGFLTHPVIPLPPLIFLQIAPSKKRQAYDSSEAKPMMLSGLGISTFKTVSQITPFSL